MLPSEAVSITLHDIQGLMAALHTMKGKSLDLILHSPGGQSEAAAQIVSYLRHKYENIRAIVPQNAMSAATMIACACESIVMAKHSAIGPIDPQLIIPMEGEGFVAPAYAVLDEIKTAKEEIASNPKMVKYWALRVSGFPFGLEKICNDAIAHSKALVSEWLKTWMLKTNPARDQLSKSIADWLSDASAHMSHGQPIDSVSARAKGMVIEDLEANQKFQDLVLAVFHATMLTFEMCNCAKIIENHEGRGIITRYK
ncbi:MAG: serine protease [Candidatus Sigynarchaeota archaeon]